MNTVCAHNRSFMLKNNKTKEITGTKDYAEGRTVSMLRNKRPGMHFINLFKVRDSKRTNFFVLALFSNAHVTPWHTTSVHR